MSRTIAVIFARGGSKGIPRKNMQLLGGTPLVELSIIHATNNKYISEVYVSSDDNEIKDHAILCGAKVVNRPKELASDTAPEWYSWKHAVESIEKLTGDFDALISLPTTSPLRADEDITKCIKTFYKDDCDSVISVTDASRNPYFNMVLEDKDGFVRVVLDNQKTVTRRQDAPRLYDITTVCYISSPQFIKTSKSILAGRTRHVLIPKKRAIDIDTQTDLLIAEFLHDLDKRIDD